MDLELIMIPSMSPLATMWSTGSEPGSVVDQGSDKRLSVGRIVRGKIEVRVVQGPEKNGWRQYDVIEPWFYL